MNTYDEGYLGEETALHTRKKVQDENKEKVFSAKEREEYLEELKNKYPDRKSLEEQFAEASLVPEKIENIF